jgi:hypothetical protein
LSSPFVLHNSFHYRQVAPVLQTEAIVNVCVV